MKPWILRRAMRCARRARRGYPSDLEMFVVVVLFGALMGMVGWLALLAPIEEVMQ